VPLRLSPPGFYVNGLLTGTTTASLACLEGPVVAIRQFAAVRQFGSDRIGSGLLTGTADLAFLTHKRHRVTTTRLLQANAHAMIRRRARSGGILARSAIKGSNHITPSGQLALRRTLEAGGTVENAAATANHRSTRTTQRSTIAGASG
jgi:hypothetical protein